MKQHSVPKFLDNFLTRTLSGTVFSWREILQLTFPNVLDCLSIMFISMLITALISSNGEASVAAVSLVTPLTWMITCIFNGISAGGTVVVAQSCGMKDPVRIRKAAGMTLWLTVAVGTVVCLPLLMFPRQVLTLLFPEAEAVVLEKARIYLSGRAWSILVFTIYTANFGILRGLGESGRCLALSVIINAAYLVFSILFLNVLRMDILGSVFALLLARFIGSAASVILLFFWKAPVKMTFGQIFTCDKGILRSTLQVSIPLGLEQACSSLGNVVAEMYMISLGTTALATHAIANSVIGVWYSPAMAAANLSVTVVGRCFGAEKYDEAKRYGVRCDQIALILVLLTSALFIPLLPALLGQYHPTPEGSPPWRKAAVLVDSQPAAVLAAVEHPAQHPPGGQRYPVPLRGVTGCAVGRDHRPWLCAGDSLQARPAGRVDRHVGVVGNPVRRLLRPLRQRKMAAQGVDEPVKIAYNVCSLLEAGVFAHEIIPGSSLL